MYIINIETQRDRLKVIDINKDTLEVIDTYRDTLEVIDINKNMLKVIYLLKKWVDSKPQTCNKDRFKVININNDRQGHVL